MMIFVFGSVELTLSAGGMIEMWYVSASGDGIVSRFRRCSRSAESRYLPISCSLRN